MNQYRIKPQYRLPLEGLVIDNFAGGGGASMGIEQALGRPVDIAINHDPIAIALHETNHPLTDHKPVSVWEIDPREVTQGRPVDLAWFSPDCKHFSKAKGGAPVEKKIRGLAWVAVRWAATVKPKVIMLENVEEFLTWGPLIDGRPCPKNKGRTFRTFVNALIRQGYQVDWRELRACDYGAPTIRKRLFLVARRDDQPITWPTPTHGAPGSPGVKSKQLKPWRTAAECIDWSIPCPSIFERKKPLAENTLRRIARGIQRFVIDAEKPFIVKGLAPFITEHANSSNQRNMHIGEPLRTLCAEVKGGHFAVVAPVIARQLGQSIGHSVDQPSATVTAGGYGKSQLVSAFLTKYYGEKSERERRGVSLNEPLHTATTENRFGLVSAHLCKHYGGNYAGPGADVTDPVPTVTTTDHNALVTSHLMKLRGTCRDGQPTSEPLPTLTAGGTHVGEVRAFLLKYYGTNIGHELNDPLQTITTKHRFGLVTVRGEQYQIVDIGMRMLEPHELFAAQGFPKDYIHDRTSDGSRLSKAAQVKLCGNSVCPPVAAALVRANLAAEVVAQERLRQ